MSEAKKKKLHIVFETSSDIKEIFTENFIRQKLNYMHKNPVSGKWNLVKDYVNYVHSNAGYYELGRRGIYGVNSLRTSDQRERRVFRLYDTLTLNFYSGMTLRRQKKMFVLSIRLSKFNHIKR